jgi:hypothetical protein
MNWRRGLFRAWLLLSVLWTAGYAYVRILTAPANYWAFPPHRNMFWARLLIAAPFPWLLTAAVFGHVLLHRLTEAGRSRRPVFYPKQDVGGTSTYRRSSETPHGSLGVFPSPQPASRPPTPHTAPHFRMPAGSRRRAGAYLLAIRQGRQNRPNPPECANPPPPLHHPLGHHPKKPSSRSVSCPRRRPRGSRDGSRRPSG